MKINFDSMKPVYVQIAETVEDDIMSGSLTEGGTAHSQLTLSRALCVNPATAAKGINLLVAKGILEKQRGNMMVITPGSTERLIKERRGKKFKELIAEIVSEAGKVNLTENDVLGEIRKHYQSLEGKQDE